MSLSCIQTPRITIITAITRCERSSRWSAVRTIFDLRSVGPRERRVQLGQLDLGVEGPLRGGRRSSAALSGKTRKIVPSAMPAASAICRVVTSLAVLEQQRHDDVDDRVASFVGGQRARRGGSRGQIVSE